MGKTINPEKNIILIGFMGVGKTTIGISLAEFLNRPFIDLDREIENKFHMPVTEIFKQYGEKEFRKAEKELTSHFSKQTNQVLSLGGGAFLQEEVRKVCMENGFVVYLEMTWETWNNRIDKLVESRPNLQGKSLLEIESLFNERQRIYTNHHLKVMTDNKTVDEIAQHIMKRLKEMSEFHE